MSPECMILKAISYLSPKYSRERVKPCFNRFGLKLCFNRSLRRRDNARESSRARKVELAASVAGDSADAANGAIGPYAQALCMLV